MKLKSHFASDEIQVAADLCRYCRCQQTMDHQAAPLVGLNVMRAFITRDSVEKANVLFSKRSLPGDDVANLHSLAQSNVIYRRKIVLAIVK